MASVDFDFNSIIERMKTKWSTTESGAKTIITGANDRLIEAFAYEEQKLAGFASYILNEAMWDKARNRSSLMSMQGIHGYNSHRKIGATGTLRISASDSFDTPPSKNILIPKWTTFSNGDTFFVTIEQSVITTSDNYIDVNVVQGEKKSQTFVATGGDFEYFVLNNDSVENNYYDIFVNDVEYSQVNIIYDSREDENTYQIINNIDFSGIEIKFGGLTFGKPLVNNDLIKVDFVETLGIDGNITELNSIDTVESTVFDIDDDQVDIYVTNTEALVGGYDYEDTESIRTNAPKIFQTGDSALRKMDYEALVQEFSFILKTSVWGADETLKDQGLNPWNNFISAEQNVVHICAITNDGNNISTAQKEEITNELNEKKGPTDLIYFEDVNFVNFYFEIDAYVTDDNYTLNTVKNNIENDLIENYSIENLDFFQKIYEEVYKSFILNIDGVGHHDTIVKIYQTESFTTGSFTASYTLSLYEIKTETINIYVKDTTDSENPYVLIGQDNGLGTIAGETGYDLTGSTINYSTGEIGLVVVSGLSGSSSDYEIKTEYLPEDDDLILNERYDFFNYDSDSTSVDVNYDTNV